MMRSLPIAAVAAVAIASPAHAALVPQRSLAGVKLGMTEAAVRAAKGAPDEINQPQHPIAGEVTEYRYGLTYVTIFPQSGVMNVTTTSKRERTSTGVGVGSTVRQVKRGIPRIRCVREFGIHHCYLGSYRAGRTVTNLVIGKRGTVRRITLGRVID
jgi:hypothetical protein